MLLPDKQLIRKHSYLITWYHAVLAFDSSVTSDMRVHARGGARGQTLEHLRIFFLSLFILYEIIHI